MPILGANESGCSIFAPTAGCNHEKKSNIALVRPNVPLPLHVRRQKLTNSNTFVHHAQSVDKSVPCFSEDVEHDILSARLDCFRDAAATFDCIESVCGSRSSFIQSSFSHYFSRRAVCYSYRDVHDLVAQTGEPNYLVARVPEPSALNISVWRELLESYEDSVVCNFLEFGWPVGFVSTVLPVFDLRTHRGALQFPEKVSLFQAPR